MIGVAITTTSRRPDHENHWQSVLSLCDGMRVEFINDVMGVAKAKNECLRKLQDCDYVFLFDDDCFPIVENWAQFFIDAHNKTGCHHFTYLHNYLHIRKVHTDQNGLSAYNNSAGCMIFLTKDIIERVGAFNEAYGMYGYEHVEYSIRCKMSELSPHHNVCPDGAEQFIYSMDLDSSRSFPFKHVPTLSVKEMEEAHTLSHAQFVETIQNPIVYLPL